METVKGAGTASDAQQAAETEMINIFSGGTRRRNPGDSVSGRRLSVELPGRRPKHATDTVREDRSSRRERTKGSRGSWMEAADWLWPQYRCRSCN